MDKESFKWNHKTAFLSIEKRTREIKKGQKEDWTAKKGLMKIISLIGIG